MTRTCRCGADRLGRLLRLQSRRKYHRRELGREVLQLVFSVVLWADDELPFQETAVVGGGLDGKDGRNDLPVGEIREVPKVRDGTSDP